MRSLLLLLAPALLAVPAAADSILLTEVVTDPQSDHSENTGGNGIAFDAIPGTGTVSSVDEFVELYNAGAVSLDLTGYVLEFLDTTPSTYTLGSDGAGEIRFSPGSNVNALLPGGFVLLGNPPGALNNALTVRVLAPDGTPIDTLEIANGGASTTADEAVAREWNGLAFGPGLLRAPISPLSPGLAPASSGPTAPGPPAPDAPDAVPEPGAVLAFIAAAACVRATGRTAGKATRRRPRGGHRPPSPRVRGARGG
jgi:hypothetical protein